MKHSQMGATSIKKRLAHNRLATVAGMRWLINLAMYVRFVTTNLLVNLRMAAGVFRIVHKVEDDTQVPDYERERLRDLIDWFNENLRVPSRFSRSGRRREYKAVCWFKPSARAHIEKMREIVWILEANGVFVQMIKTHNPGYIVYEDDYQIAAEPTAHLRL